MTKVRIKKTDPNVGTPPSGYVYYYVDETDGLLKQVDENGEIKTVTNPQTFTDELKQKLDSIEWGANAYNIVNDLVNDLTTGGETKALTAEQGKVLKQAIDNINQILGSDDTNLDTLQEIVDFIKQNKTELENLTISNIAGLEDALNNKANKVHTHTHNDITDFDNAVSNHSDVSANTNARHTHTNKTLLDKITNTGSGDKFLADDGEYKYATVCGQADNIIFTATEPRLANADNEARLFFDGTTMCFGTSDKIVKLGRLTPYVGAVNRTKIPINTISTVTILGGNFDMGTIVKFQSDVAEMLSYTVKSNEEIDVTIQTYGQTGDINIYLTNRLSDHFGNEVHLEVVIKKDLDSLLTDWNSNYSTVSSLIEYKYNFSGGDSGTYISDGGGDMYDGGNKIYTDRGGPLSYTNGNITTDNRLGQNGKYFTKKNDYVFFAAFDVNNISWIKIDGNLGADGGGSKHNGTFTIDGYRVYRKTVGGTGDPSINHIWILEDNDYTSQIIGSSTDSDLDKIVNLDQANIDRIYYTLYAKTSGRQSPIEEIQKIAQALLNNVIL